VGKVEGVDFEFWNADWKEKSGRRAETNRVQKSTLIIPVAE